MSKCDCARDLRVVLGRLSDYERAKRIMDQARFPAFLSRDVLIRNERNGGLLFYADDAAVTVVNARQSVFLVLAVARAHQSHGLGTAILEYLRPNFARVIDEWIDWFAARGYVKIGEPKQGRRYRTWIMVREELLPLAGRVSALLGDRCRCSEESEFACARHGMAEQLG